MTGNWRTSSHSGTGNCVEVGGWRTAASCDGGACVEVGNGPAVVGIRDSADRPGPVLAFGCEAWKRFAGRVKNGQVTSAS